MEDLDPEECAINEITDKLTTVDVNTSADAIRGIVDSLRRDAENRVTNSSPTVASVHLPDAYFADISSRSKRLDVPSKNLKDAYTHCTPNSRVREKSAKCCANNSSN